MPKSTKVLVEALESTASKVPPHPRRAAVWKNLLLLSLVVLVLQDIGMLAQDVWNGWHTGDWNWRWFEQLSNVMDLIPALGFAAIFVSLQEAHTRVRLRPGLSMLIAAAVSGDDRWAPGASEQPKPIAESLPSRPSTGTRITLSGWLRQDDEHLVFAVAALVQVAMLVQGLEFIFIPATDTIHMAGFALGVIGVVLCVIYVLLARSSSSQRVKFVRLMPYRRRIRWVVVGAEGISWLYLSLRVGNSSIQWTETQAFIRLANPPGAGAHDSKHDAIYALVGRDAILVWVVTPQTSEAERRASDLLCQLITTHTALPLRDIGSAVATLGATTPHAARRWSEHIRAAREMDIAPPLPTHTHRISFAWPLLVFYTLFPVLYYGALYFARHYVAP